jgi:hypothetical protein
MRIESDANVIESGPDATEYYMTVKDGQRLEQPIHFASGLEELIDKLGLREGQNDVAA